MKTIVQSNKFITQVSIGDIDTVRLHEIHNQLLPYLTWLPDSYVPSNKLESMGVYVIRAPSQQAKTRDVRYNNQATSDIQWTEEHLALWDEVESVGNNISTRLGIPDDIISDKTNLDYQFANFKSMFGWNSSSWWHTDQRKECAINVVITGSDKDYVTFTGIGPGAYRTQEYIEAADANVIATYKYTDRSKTVTPTLLNTSIPHKAHSHDEDRIMLRLVFTKSTYDQVRSWLEDGC